MSFRAIATAAILSLILGGHAVARPVNGPSWTLLDRDGRSARYVMPPQADAQPDPDLVEMDIRSEERPRGKRGSSSILTSQYDCAKKLSRQMRLWSYSGPNLTGRLEKNVLETPWEGPDKDIPVDARLFALACPAP